MKQSDLPEFTALLDCIAGLLSKPTPTPVQVGMFFRAVADYPLDTVRAALDAHLRDPQRGRFFPVPADVIAKIEEANGPERPASDEAWAIAIKARDEAETVVWTEEMAQAWGICKPVMDMGDEVGARMAFKAAYERLVGDARRAGVPVKWSVSEGFDMERRIAAVQRAEAVGLLPPGQAVQALPAIEYHGKEPFVAMPPEVRERLMELREQFVNRPSAASSLAELDRQRTNALKKEQAEKVEQYRQQADGETR